MPENEKRELTEMAQKLKDLGPANRFIIKVAMSALEARESMETTEKEDRQSDET